MNERQRDLLLTAVMLGILLTPAWLLPSWLSVAWQLAVAVVGLPALWYSWQHAPWQPTPRSELDRLLAALQLGPDSRFCDLGAGDGRVVLWLHQQTGADCTGIEAAPLQWAIARLRLAVRGTPRTRVLLGDLYTADLSGFDVVYVWGTAYSVGTERFAARMREGLRPGARLVSYHTPLVGWSPERVDEGGQRPLYTYVR